MIRFLMLFIALVVCSSCVSESKNYNDSRKTAAINVQLGLGYLKQNNPARAKEKFLRALSEDPNLPIANASMGYYFLTVGEKDLAAKYYNRALILSKDDPEIQNQYGVFLCRTERKSEAITYFLRAAQNSHYLHAAEAYENAGLCALSGSDSKEAAYYFSQAAKIDPKKRDDIRGD